MCRHQRSQLLAHLLSDVRIRGNLGFLGEAVKQFTFKASAKGTFIVRVALVGELIKHVFESGISICFCLGEDAQATEISNALLCRLDLEQ